jgi:hypothetical protein
MVAFLRWLYILIFSTMVAVTIWSATQENIMAIPPVVLNDVWFKATLIDAYFAFFFFFLWVCHREKSLPVKVLMFFAIAGLGNIAMSLYVLRALFQLKPGDGLDGLFSKQFSKQ